MGCILSVLVPYDLGSNLELTVSEICRLYYYERYQEQEKCLSEKVLLP